MQCTNEHCDFTYRNTSDSPAVPGLLVDPYDVRDPKISLPHLDRRNVPPCPCCGQGILWPGVVRFGERLPDAATARIEDWFNATPEIDLVLLIGTQRIPLDYLHQALARGARAVYFNIHGAEEDTAAMDGKDEDGSRMVIVDLSADDMDDFDWLVIGNASHTLPQIIGSALGIDFSRPARTYGNLYVVPELQAWDLVAMAELFQHPYPQS